MTALYLMEGLLELAVIVWAVVISCKSGAGNNVSP